MSGERIVFTVQNFTMEKLKIPLHKCFAPERTDINGKIDVCKSIFLQIGRIISTTIFGTVTQSKKFYIIHSLLLIRGKGKRNFCQCIKMRFRHRKLFFCYRIMQLFLAA